MDTTQTESPSGSSVDTSLQAVEVLASLRLDNPPPPASLTTLPTELIREIIESTVPYSFHSATHHERQNTLCSLSLVSKLSQSIAQPLLFEVVWIKSPHDFMRLPFAISRGGGGTNWDLVRWAIVDIPSHWAFSMRKNKVAVEMSLRKFRSAKALTLRNDTPEEIDLSFISAFEKLSSLQLSGEGWAIQGSLTIHHLHSLTLYTVSPTLMSTLFDPVTLPNLRAFALVDSRLQLDFKRIRLDHLLPRLDSLVVDFSCWESLKASLLRAQADRILIDCSHANFEHGFLPTLDIHHIRFWDIERVDEGLDYLDSFASFLAEHHTSLPRSIFLDSSFRPVSNLSSAQPDKVTEFMAVCQEHKIEVFFEPVPFSLNVVDPFLSPGFSARQKRTKN